MSKHEEETPLHRHRFRLFWTYPDPDSCVIRCCKVCGEMEDGTQWYPSYTVEGATWPDRR